MRSPIIATVFILGLALLAAACSESHFHNLEAGPGRFLPQVGGETLSLQQAQSCDEVLAAIHREQRTHIQTTAEQMLNAPYGGGVAVDDGMVLEGESSDTASAGSAPSTRGTAGAGTAEAAFDTQAAPKEFSETNNQVRGVDEADFVKTDGERIYIVQGGQLHVIDSWPAEQTALKGSVPIEGSAIEMLIDGDHAAVFSSVFQATPAPSEGAKRAPEDFCWGGGAIPGDSRGTNVTADFAPEYYGCGTNYTKITVLDTKALKVQRELYFEGNYTSSRRHGAIVRAVIQSNFGTRVRLPDVWTYLDAAKRAYENEAVFRGAVRAWRADAMQAVGATTLEDWLPRHSEGSGDGATDLDIACSGFYIPPRGLSAVGLTSVIGVDLHEDRLNGTHILAQAGQVYANGDALVMAHPSWAWDFGRGRDRTALHQFSIGGENLGARYVGSGFAPGHIHDQFSLDIHKSILRVSTTENVRTTTDPDDPTFWGEVTTVNRVTTLALRDGRLAEIGSTGPLAKGEQIFSTRFLGEMGYVVTFRQVDPLFAIDLSDPKAPTVVGELKIPGFSDYMHPLGDDHLLTIGRDTQEVRGGGVIQGGLALQIFDVSDPTAPTLKHKYVMSENGYSEANHNHKAFTYYASHGLLAFPFVNYNNGFDSSLELFRVGTGTGFKPLGSISHTRLLINGCGVEPRLDYWGCSYSPEVRRGIFIEDYIYSISYGGVLAHDVADLDTKVAEVPLPQPVYPEGGGGVTRGGVDSSVAGEATLLD